MVVLVSENSRGSKWVRREVDVALDMEKLEDRIIPVCLDETPLTEVNGWLATVQAVDARGSPDIASGLIADRIRGAAAGEA
jgi:hypothetical protein